LVTTRPSNGDFHEARIMVLAMTARAPAPTLHPHQHTLFAVSPASTTPPEGDLMTWTTPAACDFRFGFEITMYIAAR
jgi:pyrroloquinoline quinone biosynthesis protein A